ncbi:MAG TPA: gamma-glutamyltransferase, partial [Gammaproteobacteria bacterium]|nr:gamma-glutamyltransferase [Gammaproteobacteria bacterium]
MLFFPPVSIARNEIQPEDTVEIKSKAAIKTEIEMVVAAHPLAAEAGADILQKGGTAIDAMVAVQMVLNLVEPQSSGIGGGAFLLFHNAQSNSLISFDGREVAPVAADESMFLDPTGQPNRWSEMVPGGLSVGIPGTLALMDHAHARYGKLAWESLFEHALKLSKAGFSVSQRLAKSLKGYGGQRLRQFPAAADYFFPNGEPLVSGDVLTNPEFAETLIAIQRDRGETFYHGLIAEKIVSTVKDSPVNPGLLEHADLEAYRIIERPPICTQYRDHSVCGMGPPSSGGVTVAQILGILETFNLKMLGPNDPLTWHLFIEAGKLAFADRNL